MVVLVVLYCCEVEIRYPSRCLHWDRESPRFPLALLPLRYLPGYGTLNITRCCGEYRWTMSNPIGCRHRGDRLNPVDMGLGLE